jgi:hypothetical protein
MRLVSSKATSSERLPRGHLVALVPGKRPYRKCEVLVPHVSGDATYQALSITSAICVIRIWVALGSGISEQNPA